MATKKCPKCGETKPRTEFYVDKSRYDGIHSRCKQCDSKKMKAWRRRNPGKVAQLCKAWRSRNPGRGRVTAAVWRAAHPQEARRNWRNSTAHRRARFNRVQPETVNLQKVAKRDRMRCRWCGKRVAAKQLQFDHVIPISKGGVHSESNLVVAHARCNQRKSNRVITLF